MASGVAVLLKGLHHVSPWLLFGISAIIECHKTSKTRYLNDTADTQLPQSNSPPTHTKPVNSYIYNVDEKVISFQIQNLVITPLSINPRINGAGGIWAFKKI